MTEDEAKKKWCPFVRVSEDIGEPGYNRHGGGIATNSFCIASACMAWRVEWHHEQGARPEKHGYCGLAGAPQ